MKDPQKVRDKHARRDWIRSLQRDRDPAVRALAVGLLEIHRDPTKTNATKQKLFTQAAVEFARTNALKQLKPGEIVIDEAHKVERIVEASKIVGTDGKVIILDEHG